MVTVQYTVPGASFVPRIPHKPDGGSKDASQQTSDASQQDGIWKDHYSSKDDHSTSIENTGGEELPSNLNNLGAWGKGTTLAESEWHAARIGEVNYRDSGDWGSAYAMGSTDFLKLQGRVYGDTGYKDGTVTLKGGVQGRFELVGSHYQGGYTSPTLFSFGGHDINSKTTLNADAYVGATGFAEGGIALGKNDYVELGAGGFAGASATLKGSESIGDVASVNGSATAWAGIGAKADLDAGYKDGELSFHFGAGLAFGYGFDYDFGFSINVGAIGDGIYEGASDVVDGVGDAGEWVGGKAKDVANDIGDVASDIGDAICDLF